MTPAQVALNQRRLESLYGLTYLWYADLSEPVECSFDPTDDGPRLDRAIVGGVDIYPLLSSKQIEHIEWLAYRHFERRAA